MYAPSLNYAQMRPKGVESNHFAYHLEQLLKAGLVAKTERKYALTPEGMALADRVSHQDMLVRKQAHIVTSICVANDVGQMILFKHAFHPYLGLSGFPQGRVHYDEHIAAAAQRELFEKTSLDDVELTLRGTAYIHATKGGVDISKLLAHVFTGTVKGTPELTSSDKQKGTSGWGDAAKIASSECMPGFKQVLVLLEANQSLFFAEIDVEL
jgi:ADP-ribose pyrophosphatase YjhB (NUDIX family)